MQALAVFIQEGLSTNRSSCLDGYDYQYRKDKMKLFMESQDVNLWDIIKFDPYKSTKRTEAREIQKPKVEWTSEEKARFLLNSKIKLFLTCALSRYEYDKVKKCQIA